MIEWLLVFAAILVVSLVVGIYRLGNRPLWFWRVWGAASLLCGGSGIFWLVRYADVQGVGVMVHFQVAGFHFPAIAFLIGQLAFLIVGLSVLNGVQKAADDAKVAE